MEYRDEDEWLWGWDETPGIVSVWAERTGRAVIWRRAPGDGTLSREEDRFRPWLLLPALDRSEERRVGKECRSRWSPYH